MNDEIKECLDSLYYQDDFSSISYDKLLDYITNLQENNDNQMKYIAGLLVQITNLQQENERLKEYYDLIVEFNEKNLDRFCDYKSRCEKAIEYIEEMLYPIGTCVNGSDLPYDSIESILNILQNGSDDNE